MNYCEACNKPGLLIIIDYAKAFDTIEWFFIDFCLDLFGFRAYNRKWVQFYRQIPIQK